MRPHNPNRREFLQTTLITSGATLLGSVAAKAEENSKNPTLHLACNQYPWTTFYRRDGRDTSLRPDDSSPTLRLYNHWPRFCG